MNTENNVEALRLKIAARLAIEEWADLKPMYRDETTKYFDKSMKKLKDIIEAPSDSKE